MYKLFSVMLIMSANVCFSAELSEVSQQEIDHLFSYLGKSGCEFSRNGTLYSDKAAVAHLHKKYDYLLKKELLGSAEDFIKAAASNSSIIKKPYFVNCANSNPVESAVWFKTELDRYRSAR